MSGGGLRSLFQIIVDLVDGPKTAKNADEIAKKLEELKSVAPEEIHPILDKMANDEPLSLADQKVISGNFFNDANTEIFDPIQGKFFYSDKGQEKIRQDIKEQFVDVASIQMPKMTEAEIDQLAKVIESIARQKNKAIRLAELNKQGITDKNVIKKELIIAYNKPLKFDPKITASFAPYRFDVLEIQTAPQYNQFINESYENIGKALKATDKDVIYTSDDLKQLSSEVGWTDLFRFVANNDQRIKSYSNYENPAMAAKGALLFTSIDLEIQRLSKLVIEGGQDTVMVNGKVAKLTAEETKLKLAATVLATEDFMPGIVQARGATGLSLQAARSDALVNVLKKSVQTRKTNVDDLEAQNLAETNYRDSITNLYKEYDLDNIDDFAENYLKLSDDGRGNFATSYRDWMSQPKGGGKSTFSQWLQSNLVFSKISSPRTLFKAGKSMLFQSSMYLVPETAVKNLVAKPLRKQIIEPGAMAINQFSKKYLPNESNKGLLEEYVEGIKNPKYYDSELVDSLVQIQAFRHVLPIAIRNSINIVKRGETLDSGTMKALYDHKDVQRDIVDHYVAQNKPLMALILGHLPKAGAYGLGGMDDTVKTIIVATEVSKDAYKSARKVLLDTGDYELASNEFQKYLSNPNVYMDKAIDIGRDITLTNKISQADGLFERAGKNFYKAVDRFYLKPAFLLPRIMLNTIARGTDYTPLAFLKQRRKEDFLGGGDMADNVLAKQAVGAALAFSLYDRLCDLERDQTVCISGEPRNKQEELAYAGLGIEPYSINVRKDNDPSTKFTQFASLDTLENLKYILVGVTKYFQTLDELDGISMQDSADLFLSTVSVLTDAMTIDQIFNAHESIDRILDGVEAYDPTEGGETPQELIAGIVGDYFLEYGDAVAQGTGVGSPSIQQYVTDVWDPTVRDTTPENIVEGDEIFATGRNELKKYYEKKRNQYGLATDVIGFPNNNYGVLDNYGNEGKKSIITNKVTYDILPRDVASTRYLAKNGIPIPDTRLYAIDLGEEFARVRLNQGEKNQLHTYLATSKHSYIGLDGTAPFADKGDMTMWETIAEITQGDSEYAQIFRSKVPYSNDRSVATQEDEINRIFRFYQDKTKEFATQYVSDLTERAFQKQQQQGR